MIDIIVIGGGASGMMAAITAARNGAQVLLLEHADSLGKKILITGNGRCNFTNKDQQLSYYMCQDSDFPRIALDAFSSEDAISFFENLGVLTYNRQCYMYPYSGQASTIRQVLIQELEFLGVEVRCNIGIRSVKKINTDSNEYFEVNTKEGIICGKKCILACGGQTAKKTGSDGSGFIYARALGHQVTTLFPSLTAFLTDVTFLQKEAKGVRCHGGIALYINEERQASDVGELQITDYGISGIPVFQVSHYGSKALIDHQKVTISLDFLPKIERDDLEEMLFSRFINRPTASLKQQLNGLLNDKLLTAILKTCHLSSEMTAKSNQHRRITGLLTKYIKDYQLTVTAVKGFDFAQVTGGGIDVSQLSADTLESTLVPGLYFAGEMIDVDALCGGYNLQWAWSSGYLAGYSAAKKLF